MARFWPVLAIAAAAVAALVLILGSDEEGGPDSLDSKIVGYDERGDPILMTSDAERRVRKPPPPPPTPIETEEEAAARRRNERVLFLEGLVVSAEGGAPIPGARLSATFSIEPCPRIPSESWLVKGQVALEPPGVLPGEDGRFTWRVRAAGVAAKGLYDVIVEAPGHVAEMLCRPSTGSEVTVRLQKALRMPVWVTDRHGRPIEAARLLLSPAEGTEAVPGHGGQGVTDEHGRTEIDGLLPGDVMLAADHPEFMPLTFGPVDPARGGEVHMRLAPAFRLTFEIRSDDGSEIKNPSLAWETDGKPPHTGLTLLQVMQHGPPAAPLSEVRTGPVRIACDHRNVRFELKADGFEPWSPEPEPLPADGGERNLVVSLTRDTSLASLRVKFEDAQGEPVLYSAMRPVPVITRLDGMEMSSGIVLQGGEHLYFPALPAGPYRIQVRSPNHAPAAAETTVVAGEKNELTLRVGPPAKLHVRFIAPERLMVRFRLLQAGQIVPAFPEDAPPGVGTPAPGQRPLTAQGNEGAVFSGLPSGAVVIEVTSPELVATSRTVQLRVGETAEVEMDVQPK